MRGGGAEMGRAGAGKGRGPASAGKGRGPTSVGQPDGIGGQESAQQQANPCALGFIVGMICRGGS